MVNSTFVSQKQFHALLNERVFKHHLRRSLSARQIRDIVNGIGDVILAIVFDGGEVRLGKVGLFRLRFTRPHTCWNPQSRTTYEGAGAWKIIFKVARGTRKLLGAREVVEHEQSEEEQKTPRTRSRRRTVRRTGQKKKGKASPARRRARH